MIASLHHLLYSVVYTELHQSIRRFSIPTKVSECQLHHWSKLDVLSLLLYWPEHRSGFVESQQRTFGFANRGTLETMSMFKRFVEPGRLALITYGPCTVLLAVWGQRDNLRQAISINFHQLRLNSKCLFSEMAMFAFEGLKKWNSDCFLYQNM